MLSRTKQLTSVFLQTSSLFHRADAHTPSAAQPSGALPANGLVRNSGPRVCVRARRLAFLFNSDSTWKQFPRHLQRVECAGRYRRTLAAPVRSSKSKWSFTVLLCVQRTCSDSSSQAQNPLSPSVFSPHACFLCSPKLYGWLYNVLLLNTASIKAGIYCGVVRLFTS